MSISMDFRKALRWLSIVVIGFVGFQFGRFVGWMDSDEGKNPLTKAANPQSLQNLSRSVVYVSDAVKGLYPQSITSRIEYDADTKLAIVYGLLHIESIPRLSEYPSNSSVYRSEGTVTIRNGDDDMYLSRFVTSQGTVYEAYGSVSNFSKEVQTIVDEVDEYVVDNAVVFLEPREGKTEDGHNTAHFFSIVSQ